MLTADKVKVLTTLDSEVLTGLVKGAFAKRKDKFKTAKFLGITNGNQFCYQVTFQSSHEKDKIETGKVFVTYDNVNHRITADF
jgi:hypothetical protein